MCGIAGAVGPAASQQLVGRQLQLLAHRGPDASGVFASPGAVIGQTRLAVIDLVTGDPPLTSEQERCGAVLNGEVYNYRGLRKSLLDDGHDLSSEGDTEVIAHLAEQLEPVELARRLDGMFAFAVWDRRRERLVLGRDRLGKKPLYYWTKGESLVFASEIKALLAHSEVPRRMNEAALPRYLTFGYVPTPDTFFQGIKSLPPGHVLVLEDGGGPRLEQYWVPEGPPAGRRQARLTGKRAVDAVKTELAGAVQRRLISDVPLGAFLSGGVDSSGVVALMARASTQPVATFTIGFEDAEGYDERPFARLVAQRYKTDHTEFVVRPDAASLMEQLVWHHDQPFGDSSALPTYLLAELTRRHVTVALCGDGGDELFGGYERFAAALALSRLQRLPVKLQEGAAQLTVLFPATALRGRIGSVQRLLARRSEPFPDAFLSWINYIPPEWRGRLLPGHDPEAFGTAEYGAIWRESAGSELLDRLILLNIRTYLLDDLLVKVDRMAMAHGLEVRSPFLDTDLVELALGLPPSSKVRGLSLKRVLKQALADLLPNEILHRRKHGFGLPLDRWLRDDLRSYLESRLLAPSARVRQHLDPGAIDALVQQHQSRRGNHAHSLWTLLTLEEFLRKEGW